MKTVNLFLGIGLAWVAAGCVDVPSMKLDNPSPPNNACPEDWCTVETLSPGDRDLDLIFVIDTSLSMEDEQALLQRNFPALMGALREISGGLPNVHLGVVTPDLGTSPYNIPGCERPGGDGGRFLKGLDNSCMNPVNQTYLVDVEPRGCTISRTAADGQPTTCDSHSCVQAHCDVTAFMGLDGVATEPAGLLLAIDGHGCPRCRNYTNQKLEAVFSCIAQLGTGGCGMEQPLEALRRALTDHSGPNTGFLRDDAYLAVFFLTDEDDCSAKVAELFNPSGDIDSPFGTLTSFRCTEFGVVCDQPWERQMPDGPLTYTGCAPREGSDPKNMLSPISTYTNTLSQLKDVSRILVGVLAGPYEDSLTVGVDDHGNPLLRPSCGLPTQGAMPAVRLEAFVESMLQREEDRSWAFTSLCAEDYTGALTGLGTRVRHLLEAQCLTAPLCGCPDPSFAFGGDKRTALPDAEAAVCAPTCSVQEIGTSFSELPPCPADYAGGHPPLRDPALPVPACYHVTFNERCAIPCPGFSSYLGCSPAGNPLYGPSRGAELLVSRREDPPPSSRLHIQCSSAPLTEQLCHDGLDDDHDGRVDDDDPDCR